MSATPVKPADFRDSASLTSGVGSAAGASPRIFALIPCAGVGARAGRSGLPAASSLAKQYQSIAGKPLVIHTVDAFRALGPLLAGVWVVISPDDREFEAAFPGFNAPGEHLLKAGGASRAATVRNGLQALLDVGAASGHDWVLVHDAARCLVTPAQIAHLIEACRGDAVGGLLAQPLADTLKTEAPDAAGPRVGATLERAGKWLAQTPQMFRLGPLLEALLQAEQRGLNVTDEASAIEAQGLSPRLVRGSAHNFKITYPEDFALAEAILQTRQD